MSARDAVRTELIALQKVRKAWQNCQVASQVEKEASSLVQQVEQMERQAADVKQPGTAFQWLLQQTGLLALSGRLLSDGHSLAQQAAQESTKALDEATAELHAAQVQSISTMKQTPAVSTTAAAAAPNLSLTPPSSAPGDDLVKAIQAMQVQQQAAIASLTQRSAAFTASLQNQQAAPQALHKENRAGMTEEIATQRTSGNTADSNSLQPHHRAEQGASYGSWMVVGLCALGAMQLIGFALLCKNRRPT
jgi:hypothetical protein